MENNASIKQNATPEWLKKMFLIFTINYKNLWTDTVFSTEMRQATDCLWLECLKGYSSEATLKAAFQAVKILKYPPNIAEFLEIVTAIQRNLNQEQKMSELEKSRLLEEKPDKNIAKIHLKQIKDNLRKKSKSLDQ